MSGHYLISAGEAYSKTAGIKAVAQAKDFVDVSRNTLMNDPFQFERVEQGVANAISDPRGCLPTCRRKLQDEFYGRRKPNWRNRPYKGDPSRSEYRDGAINFIAVGRIPRR